MKRHGFAMQIKEGCTLSFRKNLGEIWDALTTFMDRKGMRNFSLWSAENLVFGYYETEDDFAYTTSDRHEVAEWQEELTDTFDWISTPFEDMRLMYQDYGIVREQKNLIRHRVFITKLCEGMEEEYKARHDALVEARGGAVTPGPDSNFTIWYAGGYIFGYDEIDTTMEADMSEDDIEATITWEKRMLKIMSWVTDDVDWITKEEHEHIKRIAWYQ